MKRADKRVSLKAADFSIRYIQQVNFNCVECGSGASSWVKVPGIGAQVDYAQRERYEGKRCQTTMQ